MALDGDLIRQKQNINAPGVGETTATPETSVAPSPAPTPVPVVSSNSEKTQKKATISDEVRAQAEKEAQTTREARASAHSVDVDAVAIAKLKHSIIDFLKSQGKAGTETELYEYLQELKNTKQINREELQLLSEYEKSIKDGTFKPESNTPSDKTETTPSESKTQTTKNVPNQKYIEILKDENATPEQKVKSLLTEYYTKNDPEFAKLSKNEQEKFIEQKIKEDISKLNPNNDNLSKKDVLKSYMAMSLLVIKAERENTSLESLINKPIAEINNFVEQSKKEVFSRLIDKLGNEDPETVLKDSIRMYLSITEEDFASKNKIEQDKIIAGYKEKFSKHFGLNNASPKAKEMLKNSGINVLKYLSEHNISIEEYSKMSSSEQDKILLEVASKEDIYSNLDPKSREKIDYYRTLNVAAIEIGKDEEPTYDEVFKHFEKLIKSGNYSDEDLAAYNQLKEDINNGVFKPDEKISFKSNIIKALVSSGAEKLSSQTADELTDNYVRGVLKGIEPNSDLSDEKIRDLIEGSNNDSNVDQTNTIINALKELGWSDENIAKIVERLDAAKAISRSDDTQGASAAELTDNLQIYGSQEKINTAAGVIEKIMSKRSDEFDSDYLANIKLDHNRIFTDAATSGINNDINRSDAVKANIYKAVFADATPERRAIIAQSSIETASNELKLYYGEQFATIKDSSVTQGMAAAAHNETNPDIKSYLNNCVDYAVTHNGYSSSEIKSIKTVKETGKTSFERNVEAQSTNSAQSKSQTKTSTQQSAVTNPSTTQTSNRNMTVKLSAANSDLPKQLQQTLLQLQYQSSVAQKEKAMQDLQNIIDKIQNDQQVRAQKQTEIKAQEASTDVEIAKATEAADAKSAQQKADETKIAHEAKNT